MKLSKLLHKIQVEPGSQLHLRKHDPDWTSHRAFRDLGKDELEEKTRAIVQANLRHLSEAQEILYANDVFSVLIIFQAMDAAGKDGMIKHVMSGLNPQGCQVFSFKKPSDEELDHNYLWRYWKCLPERGRIGIFNRSYYEETLVVRVHPELLERQKLPPGKRGKEFWADRFEDINSFERHLVRNGTLILKFFLNVSKKEQKRRFLERLTRPEKFWKFSAADLHERSFWEDYREAFEETLSATSTRWAPWHVVPADHKWIARAMVSEVIARAIRSLGLKAPEVSPQRLKELAAARRRLALE